MNKIAYFLLGIYVLLIPSQSLFYYVEGKTVIIHYIAYSALLAFLINEFIKNKSFSLFVTNKLLQKFFVLFGAFLIWAILSYFWSVDKSLSGKIIFSLARILILIILCAKLITSREKLFKIMEYYVLGGYFAIGSTIYEFMQTRNLNFTPERYSALGVDPNDLGVTLSIAIPIAWYFSSTHKKSLMRAIFLIYVPLCIGTVFLTGSRGALVTLSLSLLVVPLTFLKSTPKSKIFFVGSILVALYSTSLFLPDKTLDRFVRMPDDIRRADLTHRQEIWKGGFEIFSDNAVYGVGAGAYRTALYKLKQMPNVAHNTFISVLVELGLIGSGLFLCILIFLIQSILIMKGGYRFTYAVLFLAWAVGASSLSWDYYLQTWFVFVLIAIQASFFVNKKQNEQKAEQKSIQKQFDINKKIENITVNPNSS